MLIFSLFLVSFFFNDTPPTEIYTLSLHYALPISTGAHPATLYFLLASSSSPATRTSLMRRSCRSEEHTSELQSQFHLVCRLLLEKKKKYKQNERHTITYNLN